MTALTKWPYFDKLSVKLLQLIKLLVSWINFAKLKCFVQRQAPADLEWSAKNLLRSIIILRNELFEQLGYSMSHYPGTSMNVKIWLMKIWVSPCKIRKCLNSCDYQRSMPWSAQLTLHFTSIQIDRAPSRPVSVRRFYSLVKRPSAHFIGPVMAPEK